MPRKQYIKIIGEHRSANDNEFFPTNNPFNDSGMTEMFEYLESKYNFTIERIDDWQIKNTVKGCDGGSLRKPFGLRIVDNDS
tara:strand:- start:297 stop:542 length:246 start_codon:yes stop_codon:yes gene_type:complete